MQHCQVASKNPSRSPSSGRTGLRPMALNHDGAPSRAKADEGNTWEPQMMYVVKDETHIGSNLGAQWRRRLNRLVALAKRHDDEAPP
ncbi:MAG: hypothetical protein ACJAR2_004243 [Ilumatobacter sp.]|jgi:hypothetical protein